MKTRKWNSKYFYGEEIPQMSIEERRLDYRTLTKPFNLVLCNDIINAFPESVENVREEDTETRLEEVLEELEEVREEIDKLHFDIAETEDDNKIEEIHEKLAPLEDKESELEIEQYELEDILEGSEVYQWYIVDDMGAAIIEEFTDDPLYIIEDLGVYVWGVTHWGTSWDYVFTDVEIELEK